MTKIAMCGMIYTRRGPYPEDKGGQSEHAPLISTNGHNDDDANASYGDDDAKYSARVVLAGHLGFH
jgi:hypothetical protein